MLSYFQKQYGNWSSEGGLYVTSEPKWERRHDLEGINFRTVNVEMAPFTNKMDPVPGRPQPFEWEMEGGIFTDVFHKFQVVFSKW